MRAPLQMRRHRLFAARLRQVLDETRQLAIGREVQPKRPLTFGLNLVTKVRRDRIDHTALDAGFRNHKFSHATHDRTGRRLRDHAHGFDRMPGELGAKVFAPSHVETTVSRLKGAIGTARFAKRGTQAPSDPSLGQLPPPIAKTTASAWTASGPSAVSKRNAPLSSHPHQRCRTWMVNPILAQPPQPGAQERRGLHIGGKHAAGGADTGLDTESPRPFAERVGTQLGQPGRHRFSARAIPGEKSSVGSEWVRFSPPFPAKRNFRPMDAMESYRFTRAPPASAASAAMSPAGPPPIMAMFVFPRISPSQFKYSSLEAVWPDRLIAQWKSLEPYPMKMSKAQAKIQLGSGGGRGTRTTVGNFF